MHKRYCWGAAVLAGAVVALSAIPCAAQPPITVGQCPQAVPEEYIYGPEARVNHSDIDIELRSLYMNARVRSAIENELDICKKPKESGLFVKSVVLENLQNPQTPPTHIISIIVEPWLRAQNGNKVRIGGSYRLRLRIEVYAITPTNFPDTSVRRRWLCPPEPACEAQKLEQICGPSVEGPAALLGDPAALSSGLASTPPEPRLSLAHCPPDPTCNTDEAVLIVLRFHELVSLGDRRLVASGAEPPSPFGESPNPVARCEGQIDVVDAGVIGGIWQELRDTKPIVLPTARITEMVSSLMGESIEVRALALSSDRDLKIGLALNRGVQRPFDPTAFQTRVQNVDWALVINPDLLVPSIKTQVESEIKRRASGVHISGTTVDFTDDGIKIHARGEKSLCGGINFTVDAVLRPQMCKNQSDQSELILCRGDPDIYTSGVAQICAIPEVLAKWANQVALEVVSKLLSRGATPAGGCEKIALEFPVGKDEVFYGTNLDMDNVFMLLGRSSAADRLVSRPLAPASCDTVRRPSECPRCCDWEGDRCTECIPLDASCR